MVQENKTKKKQGCKPSSKKHKSRQSKQNGQRTGVLIVESTQIIPPTPAAIAINILPIHSVWACKCLTKYSVYGRTCRTNSTFQFFLNNKCL